MHSKHSGAGASLLSQCRSCCWDICSTLSYTKQGHRPRIEVQWHTPQAPLLSDSITTTDTPICLWLLQFGVLVKPTVHPSPSHTRNTYPADYTLTSCPLLCPCSPAAAAAVPCPCQARSQRLARSHVQQAQALDLPHKCTATSCQC